MMPSFIFKNVSIISLGSCSDSWISLICWICSLKRMKVTSRFYYWPSSSINWPLISDFFSWESTSSIVAYSYVKPGVTIFSVLWWFYYYLCCFFTLVVLRVAKLGAVTIDCRSDGLPGWPSDLSISAKDNTSNFIWHIFMSSRRKTFVYSFITRYRSDMTSWCWAEKRALTR